MHGVQRRAHDPTENDAAIAACLAEADLAERSVSRDEWVQSAEQGILARSFDGDLSMEELDRQRRAMRRFEIRATLAARARRRSDGADAGFSFSPGDREAREPRAGAGRTRQGAAAGGANQEVCCACMDREANALLVPCGHRTVCVGCARKLVPPRCPVCRYEVQQISVIG